MQQSHNGGSHGDTEKNLRKGKGSNPRSRANLRPFGPGHDPRRNLTGRPRSFDAVREIAQQLAQQKEDNGELAIVNVLSEWRVSREPALQKAFVEYAFGKVPDKIEATGLENKTTLVLHFDHEKGVTR